MEELSELLNATRPPLPGEALLGFLLWHDAENGLPALTTAGLCSRHQTGPRTLGDLALGHMATVFDLEQVANITGQSLASIVALTMRDELRALFGPDATGYAIGRRTEFGVCPDCARERFIARDWALPMVEVCAKHLLWLQPLCPACRSPIWMVGADQTPFVCSCGFEWSELPRVRPTPQQAGIQWRVIRAYRWILAELPPDISVAAARLAELEAEGMRFSRGFEAPMHWPQGFPATKTYRSLGSIVRLLVSRNLPPKRLVEALPVPPPPSRMSCLNQTCRAGPEWIRRNGARNGEWETYCAWCGSRFLGDRIILSFDFDHGDQRLSVRAVQRARARLVRWRVALWRAAALLMCTKRPEDIRIEEVFKEARVPAAGYLRADRLNLVRIVKATLLGWRPLGEDVDPYSPLDARWRPPVALRRGSRLSPESPLRWGPDGRRSFVFLADHVRSPTRVLRKTQSEEGRRRSYHRFRYLTLKLEPALAREVT